MENEDELIKKNKNKKNKQIKRGNPPFFIFKMDIHENNRI